MLILHETPAGYALFKLLDKSAKKDADSIYKHFETPEAAAKIIKLKAFHPFQDTNDALAAATSICDGKLDKNLKKFLKGQLGEGDKSKLAVGDVKLGALIKEKLGLKCLFDNSCAELIRGIRTQIESLLTGITQEDASAMKLGLSHSLARYKLKFSPDKVDTMIVQAISLLDELDKELNTYAMRVKEWYGWHFPEMTRIVGDNLQYAQVVKKMGARTNASTCDLSDILPEDKEAELKDAAETSMGTEVADEDMENIIMLCDQVIEITLYRTELYEYLNNRMQAIAPNLTCMVGELVGARLIAHAGSLMSLAKHPASTVQILGAEKALFRALKSKHDTPKYGLIYHASLVGQAAPKHKGKISRVLAAKTALAIRMDALGETEGVTIGIANKAKVEMRLRQLEGGVVHSLSGNGKANAKQEAYSKSATPAKTYSDSTDVTMELSKEEKKKAKKAKKAAKKAAEAAPAADSVTPKKKKKKRKLEDDAAAAGDAEKSAKKKKKKKQKTSE